MSLRNHWTSAADSGNKALGAAQTGGGLRVGITRVVTDFMNVWEQPQDRNCA